MFIKNLINNDFIGPLRINWPNHYIPVNFSDKFLNLGKGGFLLEFDFKN